MTAEPDKKSGSAEKISIDLIGAQRLASKIQRVVRLGKSTKGEMKETDIFYYNYLSLQIKNMLNELEQLKNKSWSTRSKKLLNEIYINIFNVLNELSSFQQIGYNNVVDLKGNANIIKLNMLINIDTEISSLIIHLKNNIKKLESNTRLIKAIHNQIQQLISIFNELIHKRMDLLKN